MSHSSSLFNTTSTNGPSALVYFRATFSTPISVLNERIISTTKHTSNNILTSTLYSIVDQTTSGHSNITCHEIKYDYISKKPLFNVVRYISQNLNRFFILPAIVLNLCAFYILRRTRMNRSSSIAFYMQVLALCDVAFFALRVVFDELSSLKAGKQILTTGLCKFLFLMVNSVNYTTVWLIAAMNADKFLAVCLPLRVSDLLSRKKAYAVVIAVITCSMLVGSVPASRTVLKSNGYCWLATAQDEKLVFILDASFWCFIPFFVISILNAAIFIALLRARREASHLHETINTSNNQSMMRSSTSNYLKIPLNPKTKNQFRSSNSNLSASNRSRIQSQNLQITIMLITISISFFVLTLPNAIYYLLIFLRVLIESWRAVKCDANVYQNLDAFVRTSAVMYLISNITSDLMHVVNFFLYFISGARFRAEFRRLIFYQLCRWCCKTEDPLTGKDTIPNERSCVRSSGVGTGIRQQRASNMSYTRTTRDPHKFKQPMMRLSSVSNIAAADGNLSTSLEGQTKPSHCTSTTMNNSGKDDKKEADRLLRHE